ncbi:LysR family transcriptional regulator [Flexibacterium corallicola]|uniref:LysR family transcriptional regulator n=1 Tax=Flexibacterium corallicola TaxID=3037259 RepID=UPI00286EE7F0|nr:LysR family transcriptional regulator [Pseudovibrio sp. M1P-2-3]
MKKLASSKKWFSDIEKYKTRRLVWDDARAFLAVSRYGTLSAAAASLTMGIATLSRRIDRLENALGVPLFTRQQSGYLLTEDGRNLVEKAEVLEEAALSFGAEAGRQAQLCGKVRLATAENLATSLILPALGEFKRQYPGLTVEVITDIATVNVHRRDADLAIRMVKPERGNVTIKRLGVLGFGLYASKDYARERRAELERGSYETDEFIAWGGAQAYLPAAQWVERILHGRAPAVTTTSLATQVSAVKAGLGLAVIPHLLAQKQGLVCIDPDIGLDQPIYLVIQTDLAQSRKVRVLADFLSDLIVDHRGKLRGY